jgi:hypothetical protein
MLVLSRIKNINNVSSWTFFVTGILVGSFYEAFVFICFLSLILYSFFRKEKVLIRSFWLLIGQFVWTLGRAFTLKFTEVADPRSEFFIGRTFSDFNKAILSSTSNQEISTTSSIPSIGLQLVLISTLAIAVGFFAGQITKKNMNTRSIDNQTLQSITSVTLAVTFTICGSFFRPVFVETGRQSLGLSISLIVFAFAQCQRFLRRQTVNGNSNKVAPNS